MQRFPVNLMARTTSENMSNSSRNMAAERAELSGNRMKKTQPELLSGWKDISNYLGKGIRTVQRYELELGLPIRRPAGKVRGSVLATRSELDAWIAASPMREAPPLEKIPTGSFHGEVLHNALKKHRCLQERMLGLSDEFSKSVAALQATLFSVFDADLFPGCGRGSQAIDGAVEAAILRSADQQFGSTSLGLTQFDGYGAQKVLERRNEHFKSERSSAA
jgi:hypothetical protein